jgi:hypothetical protein
VRSQVVSGMNGAQKCEPELVVFCFKLISIAYNELCVMIRVMCTMYARPDLVHINPYKVVQIVLHSIHHHQSSVSFPYLPYLLATRKHNPQ